MLRDKAGSAVTFERLTIGEIVTSGEVQQEAARALAARGSKRATRRISR
jgi:hypothetical protein